MEEKASDEVEQIGPWKRYFSKSYGKYYWFNTVDKTKSWETPKLSGSKRPIEDNSVITSAKKQVVMKVVETPKVAIIVPFRDLEVEQKRGKQLEVFLTEMHRYFQANNVHIYIIEQSNDKRKFNRGKLLNIGFDIAKKEKCEVFVFHDVDLIPSPDLLEFYISLPKDNPVHLAKAWDRYSKNPNYFGGVVSFSARMFEEINGFPNNFWGWGGEDDELFKRISKKKMRPMTPNKGKYTDLEEMNLSQKLSYLKEKNILKCMNKNELLKEHEKTWETNGLNNLKYEFISRKACGEKASRILVNCGLNKHWTDERSGITDKQY